MPSETFTIARHGEYWGVSSGGTVLAISRSKRAAEELARSASRMLRPGPGQGDATVRAERRSFTRD